MLLIESHSPWRSGGRAHSRLGHVCSQVHEGACKCRFNFHRLPIQNASSLSILLIYVGTQLATTLQKQYNFQHNTQEELERFKQYRETLKPLVTDTAYMVNAALDAGKSVLAEGAYHIISYDPCLCCAVTCDGY